MSNPGVLVLSNQSGRFNKIKRFQIEDNIGESIHLHIDNLRFDFTIQEFLEFSSLIRNALNELDVISGYDISSFDESFLFKSIPYIKNLVKIEKEKVKLSQLSFILQPPRSNALMFKRVGTITDLPAYKYLTTGDPQFLECDHSNYLGLNNEQRLKSIFHSIQSHGYPYNGKYIILYNGQDIVRDGQHRSATLASIYGPDYEIDILRFYFSTNKHLISIKSSNLKGFLYNAYQTGKRYIKAMRRGSIWP